MVLRGRLLAAVPRPEACGTAPRLRRLCRLLDELRLAGRRVSYELPVPGRCLAGEGGSDRGRDSRGQGGGGAHVRLRRLAVLRRGGPFVGGGRVAGLRGSREAHTLPALVRRAQPGPVVSADHAGSVAASAARGTGASNTTIRTYFGVSDRSAQNRSRRKGRKSSPAIVLGDRHPIPERNGSGDSRHSAN